MSEVQDQGIDEDAGKITRDLREEAGIGAFSGFIKGILFRRALSSLF